MGEFIEQVFGWRPFDGIFLYAMDSLKYRLMSCRQFSWENMVRFGMKSTKNSYAVTLLRTLLVT